MCGLLTVANSEDICLVAEVLVGIQEFLKHRTLILLLHSLLHLKVMKQCSPLYMQQVNTVGW